MLFDTYRDMLKFSVTPVNLGPRLEESKKAAAFYDALDKIDASEIDCFMSENAYRGLKERYAACEKAYVTARTIPHGVDRARVSKFEGFRSKFDSAELVILFRLDMEKIQIVNDDDEAILRNRRKLDEMKKRMANFNKSKTPVPEKIKTDFQELLQRQSQAEDERQENKSRAASNLRVETIEQKITKLFADYHTLAPSNYSRYTSQITRIKSDYNALTTEEKSRVKNYNLFTQFCTKYRQVEKSNRVRDWTKKFFLKFLFVLATAAVCVGFYFILTSDWIGVAPNWLFSHKVSLWSWHNWGHLHNSLWESGMAGFFRVILWVPAFLIDLFLWAIEGIWWVIVAISWPIRWGVSRLLGVIFYALFYGLPGIAAVGSVVGIFMLWRDNRVVTVKNLINSALCIGCAVTLYLVAFVF